MYGKIDESGKFIPAHNKVTHEGNKTIIEPMTPEELKAGGYKEVLTASGTGKPGKGMKPQPVYEDKGDHIIRRINWIAIQQPSESEA